MQQDTRLPLSIPGAWLVRPGPEHLAEGLAALDAGWSADTLRGAAAAREEAEALRRDPAAWMARSDDPVGEGLVTLPDGSQAQRLPWMRRWIWDGGFCGSINLRWQPGTAELPPHVLGHIGYAVVPWRRGRGLASAALAAMLGPARALGLPWVELTTDDDNLASQRVIARNGGALVERFTKPAAYGGHTGQRWRIPL